MYLLNHGISGLSICFMVFGATASSIFCNLVLKLILLSKNSQENMMRERAIFGSITNIFIAINVIGTTDHQNRKSMVRTQEIKCIDIYYENTLQK